MKATKHSIMEHIKKVKEMINFYSDEELFEEEVKDTKKKIILSLEEDKGEKIEQSLSMFRYYCNCLGEYEGTEIFLYDNEGSGIRETKHLKNALNKWDNKDYQKLGVFIIPIDVHS